MENLLLLHGALGSGEELKGIENELRSTFNVHVLKLPGHGGNTMPEEFSIPEFSSYVKEYITAHSLYQPAVFGYSMGGYVALHLAKSNAGIFKKIITLATKFKWDQGIAAKEASQLDPETIEQKVPKFARMLESRHTTENWKLVLEKTASMLIKMGEKPPLQLEDYSSIQIPVLLMLGDRDKMVSLEETIEVFKKLPDSGLAVLPHTPHPIEQADPSLISLFCRRFLR